MLKVAIPGTEIEKPASKEMNLPLFSLNGGGLFSGPNPFSSLLPAVISPVLD